LAHGRLGHAIVGLGRGRCVARALSDHILHDEAANLHQ